MAELLVRSVGEGGKQNTLKVRRGRGKQEAAAMLG